MEDEAGEDTVLLRRLPLVGRGGKLAGFSTGRDGMGRREGGEEGAGEGGEGGEAARWGGRGRFSLLCVPWELKGP